MGFMDKLRGELIDVVEWVDDSRHTLVWRFPRYHNQIKNGAQLIVRPGQSAIFVRQGQVADVFGPGQYRLETKNLPILSTLEGWKYGFDSPFKAEVYFVSTRQIPDLKWGTPNAVMMRDPDFGPIRLRAFGTYTLKAADARALLQELVGADSNFEAEEVSELLRSIINHTFAELVASSEIAALDLAENYQELSEELRRRVVLDVKAGRGAFMKTPEQARELAEALVAVGSEAGTKVSALLTDMNAPLGRTVGNAMETAEALEVLRGEGPEDLVELTIALGAEMLRVVGLVSSADDGADKMRGAIADGSGARVMERMIEAQSGDPSVVESPSKLPSTAHTVDVLADAAGVVTAIDALEIGLSAVAMGAGRTRADQDVDHAVGIELCCRRGEPIEAGQPLAVLHVHDPEASDEIAVRVRKAFTLDPDGAAEEPPTILESILA